MAHQLEAAMEFGRRIQKGFLPEALPSVPGYEVSSWWQPAEFVSGDYYDWFQLSNGQMAFVIGDVSGHGLGPSLIMASLRAMLHVLAKTVSEPDRIVDLVSESIMDDLKQGHFVTFLLVTLNPSNHEARFANAGHAPALHLDAGSGVFSRLKATRLPLGLPNVSPAKFDPHVFLLPGDLIVMGTDGCIEVHNEDDDMFGTERLEEVILEHHHKSADEIVAAVRDAVQAFHGRPLPPDDSTLMIIKRKK
jgi:serine phosphatase RsbU (regulator of sigma subunit)